MAIVPTIRPQLERKIQGSGYRQQLNAPDLSGVADGLVNMGQAVQKVGQIGTAFYLDSETEAAHKAWGQAHAGIQGVSAELRGLDGTAVTEMPPATAQDGTPITTPDPAYLSQAKKKLREVYDANTKGLSGLAKRKFDEQWAPQEAMAMTAFKTHYDSENKKVAVARADVQSDQYAHDLVSNSTDPAAVRHARFGIMSQQALKGRLLGMPDEVIQKNMRTELTRGHLNAISMLLSEDRVQEADAYFNANQADMDPRLAAEAKADVAKRGAQVVGNGAASFAMAVASGDEIAAKAVVRKTLVDNPRALAAAEAKIQADAADLRQARNDKHIKDLSAVHDRIVPGIGVTANSALEAVQGLSGTLRLEAQRIYNEFWDKPGGSSGSAGTAAVSGGTTKGAGDVEAPWPKGTPAAEADAKQFRIEADNGVIALADPIKIDAKTIMSSPENAAAAAANITSAFVDGVSVFVISPEGAASQLRMRGNQLVNAEGEVVELANLGGSTVKIASRASSLHTLDAQTMNGILIRRATLGHWPKETYDTNMKYLEDTLKKGRVSDKQIKDTLGMAPADFDTIVTNNPGILDALRARLGTVKGQVDSLKMQQEFGLLLREGEQADGTNSNLFQAIQAGAEDNWLPELTPGEEAQSFVEFNRASGGTKVDVNKSVIRKFWLIKKTGQTDTPTFREAIRTIPTVENGRILTQEERESRAAAKVVYGSPSLEFRKTAGKP